MRANMQITKADKRIAKVSSCDEPERTWPQRFNEALQSEPQHLSLIRRQSKVNCLGQTGSLAIRHTPSWISFSLLTTSAHILLHSGIIFTEASLLHHKISTASINYAEIKMSKWIACVSIVYTQSKQRETMYFLPAVVLSSCPSSVCEPEVNKFIILACFPTFI